jgi:hypothetical protein
MGSPLAPGVDRQAGHAASQQWVVNQRAWDLSEGARPHRAITPHKPVCRATHTPSRCPVVVQAVGIPDRSPRAESLKSRGKPLLIDTVRSRIADWTTRTLPRPLPL